MEQYKKPLIYGYIISNILFQVLFLSLYFIFSDMYLYGTTYFRFMTREEADWLIKYNAAGGYNIVYYAIIDLLRRMIIFIDLIGLYFLYSKKRNLIPIPKLWKIIIPAVGILIYIPCFYYIKYDAPHYTMYLALFPVEIFSLVSLGLIIAGKWHERLKEKC